MFEIGYVKSSRVGKLNLAMKFSTERRSQLLPISIEIKQDYYDSNDQFIVVITIIFGSFVVLVFIVVG